LEKEKNNATIIFLKENDNIYLDEILLSLFDENILKYFESIKTDNSKIENQSLQIFKNCIQYIENALSQSELWNKLGVLYCISFIKLYCYHLADAIYDNYFDDLKDINSHEIFKFLNSKDEFRKVIKIYILKLLNIIKFEDYQSFINFIKEKELFINDFDFEEKVPFTLKELFIHNDSFDQYKQLRQIYSINKMENFKSLDKFLEVIGHDHDPKNIFNFFNLIINEEISNLRKVKKINNKRYTNLYNYISSILNSINLPVLPEKVISIYFSINSVKKQIDGIKTFSPLEYEILLYAHKFAFICSFAKQNTFYYNILSNGVKEYLENTYIPGGESNITLKIQSSQEIKKFIEKGGKEAVYMCSCGKWYIVDGCGGPMEKYNCTNCKNEIGGTDHRLVEREGHFRIYKTEEEKNNADRYRFYIGNYKMYNTFVEEIEHEKSNALLTKGHISVKRENFIHKTKKVRGMNHITYRILSFIFYSCIYYDEQLENLTKDDLKHFYYKQSNEKYESILSILNDIWDHLKKALSRKQISNIQVFLNMVIPDLFNLISENNYCMGSLEERNDFENKCDSIIRRSIENYQNYLSVYTMNKQEILEINDDTIKSILEETSNVTKLPKNTYPLIKYFYAANYPTNQKFQDALDNSGQNYPVINNYLRASTEDNDRMKFLENFKFINPLVTYSLDKYSNKYTRTEAKEIKIKDELNEDVTMKKLFKNFRKGWKNIYKSLSNYDCHGVLPEKCIKKEDSLAYILNDEHEKKDYGKYIANAYKHFITFQNEFLVPLIETPSINNYLYSYSNQIKKKKVIQKASNDEIVSLSFEKSIFNSFNDLIYSFSHRDYYIENENDNENGNEWENRKGNDSINYSNYKENLFDLDGIEKELTKILLSGKRLFENEHNQEFIAYSFEGLNKNNNIILDFKEKINNESSLTDEDKNDINKLVQNLNYKIILMNLQSLFLYFTNKRNITGEETLQEELNILPVRIIKLDQEFKMAFDNLQKQIKLNQLVDFYEYVELLSFDNIKKDISKEASNELDKDQQEKLADHFNKENLIIQKIDLKETIRKFMSRYLVNDIFNHYDWNIFYYLNIDLKPELWDKKFAYLDNENKRKFEEEIEELQKIDIKIGQSLDLYNKLNEKLEKKQKSSKNANNDHSTKKKSKKSDKKKATTESKNTKSKTNKGKKNENKKQNKTK